MQLKNREIIELAKFFIFDKDASNIQYTFEANKKMQKNFAIFREIFNTVYSIETSIIDLKKSDLYKEFLEELKSNVSDLLMHDENGKLLESDSGEVPITKGKESDVLKAQSELFKTEKYADLSAQMVSKEEELRAIMSEVNSSDIQTIATSDINSSLTLTSNQWSVLTLLIETSDN